MAFVGLLRFPILQNLSFFNATEPKISDNLQARYGASIPFAQAFVREHIQRHHSIF
jgi:hypothetical protein